MIRLACTLAIVVPAIAAAQPRHDDLELARPELRSMEVTHYLVRGGKLALENRELRSYDAKGHLTHQEYRTPDGSLLLSNDFTWDAAGHKTSSLYREGTTRVERRDYTYKLDAQGRIAESTLRDPSKPAGEYLRFVYAWEPDGSREITQYRHYPSEGPYRSDTESIDAAGRTTRSCREHGGCDLLEYDARGELSRIRQQHGPEHHYLVYETTYDRFGRVASVKLGGMRTDYTWNTRGDVLEVVSHVIAAGAGTLQGKSVYTYRYR